MLLQPTGCITYSLFAYYGAEMVTDASATPDTDQYKRT